VPVPKKKKTKQSKTHDRETATWQVQTAKVRFSEVVRRARANGPQVVTRQGEEEVVILPVEQYKKLTARPKQPRLVQFFAESPLAEAGLELERTQDYGRTVDL
jgi:antitoxin Phd